jgi:hypothetical protein
MQNSIKLFLLMAVVCSLHASHKKADFSFALVGVNFDYKEYDADNTLLDSEKSSYSDIVGYEIGYKYHLTSSALAVKFLYAGGNTQYTGSLLGGSLGYGSYKSTTKNTLVDFDVLYTRNYHINEKFSLMYGGGVGYSSWLRQLSAFQEELYRWFYGEILLGIDMALFEKIDICTTVQYQHAIAPVMETNFGVDFDLGTTSVAIFEFRIGYEIFENTELYGSYNFKQQTIHASGIEYINSTAYLEPDSTAKNQYMMFGFLLKY